jgi:hypothetical protein
MLTASPAIVHLDDAGKHPIFARGVDDAGKLLILARGIGDVLCGADIEDSLARDILLVSVVLRSGVESVVDTSEKEETEDESRPLLLWTPLNSFLSSLDTGEEE